LRDIALEGKVESVIDESADVPSLETVSELEYWVLKADVLKTALELDIFTVIHQGHNTLNSIVRALELDSRGLGILLDALCPLGFLQKTSSTYGLTPVSETYFVRGKETFYGDWILRTQFAWQTRSQSADAVRKGQAVGGDYSNPDKEDEWVMDYSPALLRWRKAAATALKRWHSLGIDDTGCPAPRILDVACGSGVKTMAIGLENKNARIALLDSPKMLRLACRLADIMGVRKQIELCPGDLANAEIEKEGFDIIHFGLILYYYRDHMLLDILQRAYEGLKHGGTLVINEYFADENRCENETALLVSYQLLLFAPNSEVRSFIDYRKILETVGYSDVELHNDTLLTAKKGS
jgi:ubiquinone/menaquinone biosynthesis C-methylase UbiE